jgi:hypothetical protein
MKKLKLKFYHITFSIEIKDGIDQNWKENQINSNYNLKWMNKFY